MWVADEDVTCYCTQKQSGRTEDSGNSRQMGRKRTGFVRGSRDSYMAKNLMNKAHKATNKAYRKGYDRIFKKVKPIKNIRGADTKKNTP